MANIFHSVFVTFLIVTFLGIWCQGVVCRESILKDDKHHQSQKSTPKFFIQTGNSRQVHNSKGLHKREGTIARRGKAFCCSDDSVSKSNSYTFMPSRNSNSPTLELRLVQRQQRAGAVIQLGVCELKSTIEEITPILLEPTGIPEFITCYLPDTTTTLRRYIELAKQKVTRLSSSLSSSTTVPPRHETLYCVINKDHILESFPVARSLCESSLHGSFNPGRLAHQDYISFGQKPAKV